MQEGPYNGIYVAQYYRFNISQGVRLDERFNHLRNLSETKRFSTNVFVNLAFAVARHLEVTVGYSSSLSTEAGFVGASEVDAGESVGVNLTL